MELATKNSLRTEMAFSLQNETWDMTGCWGEWEAPDCASIPNLLFLLREDCHHSLTYLDPLGSTWKKERAKEIHLQQFVTPSAVRVTSQQLVLTGLGYSHYQRGNSIRESQAPISRSWQKPISFHRSLQLLGRKHQAWPLRKHSDQKGNKIRSQN